jgi:hypothetical protein
MIAEEAHSGSAGTTILLFTKNLCSKQHAATLFFSKLFIATGKGRHITIYRTNAPPLCAHISILFGVYVFVVCVGIVSHR